jgi:phage terminase large subunit
MLEDMKDRDYVYYQIYALGEWGVLGNLIFTNYSVEEIPTDDNEYSSIYQGLDFGFNDPSAYIKIGFKDDELYIYDELYLRGLTNNELIPYVQEKAGKGRIIADSSEPDRIKEFRQANVDISPAVKGKDSIKAGLDWAKRMKIYIHPRCINFINEIQGYKYREDKDGNVYDEPIDINNHLMDALRYALEPLRNDRKITTFSKYGLGI